MTPACLNMDGVNESYIAYQETRAKGRSGLIVTQVAGVHETARYTSHLIMADSDAIPGYAIWLGITMARW